MKDSEAIMRKLEAPASLTELAYKSIRESILRGEVAAGARFTEETLSRRLGISKSPVREALARVEAEGLIEITPRRGATVREFSRDEVHDLYDLRTALEVHAILTADISPVLLAKLRKQVDTMRRHQAAGERERYLAEDVAFHAGIASATGNKLLVQALERVESQIALCRRKTYDLMVSKAPDAHLGIIDALENSHRSVAAKAMRKHITDACQQLVQALE